MSLEADLAKKILLIAVSAALAGYLLLQIEVMEVVRAIAGFPPGYLAAGFALFLAGHLVRSARAGILLGGRVSTRELFSIIAVQTAAVGFLPFRSGEFSLMYLLKREHDVDYPEGAAVLVLAKTLDFVMVVSLFFVSVAALEVVPAFLRELLPVAGALFFVLALSLFLIGKSREIYARLPAFFREGPLAEGRLMEAVKRVFKGTEVIRSKKTLAMSVGATLLLWVLLYGSNFCVFYGVGLKLTVLEMAFVATSMSLFANLPIHSPGGFGTTESFWTIVLVALGVSKQTSIATGFASHLITIAFALVFMLYGLIVLFRKKRARAA